MALIQNLADELLSNIFSYLAGDKPLLCKIAIQSKRFSALVRPILVRKVQFVNGHSRRKELFLRSIMESSLLASMVHDLSFGWSKGDTSVHSVNNALLERLSRLRSLTLRALWDKPPWRHQFLEKNSLEFLTRLALELRDLTSADVVKYIFLRRLKSMSITCMAQPTLPQLPRNKPQLPRNNSYGDSSISFLKLGPGFHLPEAVLNEILRYPGNLKTLVTSLPGEDCTDIFRPGQNLETPLSQIAVTTALDPTKHSLEELSLVDENCIWPSHDGSRTDLSNFTAIKKLQISSLCYFLPGNSKRDGIVYLLPVSLEEIEIVYGMDSAISPVPMEDKTDHIFSNDAGDMSPDFNWMLDLANAKGSGRLPALNKVALTECVWDRFNGHDHGLMSSDWNIPKLVMKAFRQAGIELIASARAVNGQPYMWRRRTEDVDEFHIIYQ